MSRTFGEKLPGPYPPVGPDSRAVARQGLGPVRRSRTGGGRDLDPSSGPIALDRGARLLELCRYGEAEGELRHASLLLPESPWPHYNLSWIYQELGDYENAAWEYETAIDLVPHSAEILENLLLVYTHLGTKPKRRIELIDRALRTDPDPDWQRWLRLQRALLQGVTEAENNLQDLNEGFPEN